MTNIIKNRNAEPAAFGSVLDQLFPKNANALLDDAFWGFGSPETHAIPPVNIRETAEGYELELAAPGLKKSDLHLKLEGDTLTISYGQQTEHQTEAQDEPAPVNKTENASTKWVRREFVQPPFARHFELGETIDRDKISARYDNGVLYLTLSKKENVRPASRQININ